MKENNPSLPLRIVEDFHSSNLKIGVREEDFHSSLCVTAHEGLMFDLS
jgi:hypothetical protein